MTALARDLQLCLAEVLREPAPEAAAGIDPLRFYGQWLAERNLGLVPVAGPEAFAWPGHWLAAVEDGAGERRAVLMFGSPSGPWLDPAGAYRGQAGVVAGWLVAPLDLHLPTRAPYSAGAGAAAAPGKVAAILLAPTAEAPLQRVAAAEAVAGRGLAGDRYAEGCGSFNAPGRGYQLTLVEAEVLDEIGLAWADARRNIVVRGLGLNALVGERFRIGEAECVGARLAEPCAHLERLARPGLLRPLVHRAGLRADIVAGGLVAVGDDVEPL